MVIILAATETAIVVAAVLSDLRVVSLNPYKLGSDIIISVL